MRDSLLCLRNIRGPARLGNATHNLLILRGFQALSVLGTQIVLGRLQTPQSLNRKFT